MVSRFQQQTIREQALSQTYIKHVSLIKMLRRISLFVHGNMNLMYGIGAITPLIVLNSLFFNPRHGRIPRCYHRVISDPRPLSLVNWMLL